METKANYLIVGVFAVFSILLGIFCIYWINSPNNLTEKRLIRFRISGSASGLSQGSAVSFNGVKIGQVESVYIDISNPSIAIAEAKINKNTPITISTQAYVGIANLTGSANIELKGGNIKEKNIFKEADSKKIVPEIYAFPSPVTDLLQTAQSIFRRANNVITDLEKLTHDIHKPLVQTADAALKFSDALANNAGNVDRFLTSFSVLSNEISGVAGKLDGTIQSTERILQSIDEKKVISILNNLDGFAKNIGETNNKFSIFLDKINTTVNHTNHFFVKTTKTIDKVDAIFSSFNPETIKNSIETIDKIVKKTDIVADSAAKTATVFNKRAEDINSIINNTHIFSKKLSEASLRFDYILVRLEKILGSPDSKDFSIEVRETLRSYREAADTFNEKIKTITEGVERFSDRGLRDMQNLIVETGRSISRIERAITDFERNPQRILGSGTGDIPRYKGQKK